MLRRTSPCSAELAAGQDEQSSQMPQIARLVVVEAPLRVVVTAGLVAEEGNPTSPCSNGRYSNGRVARVCDNELHRVCRH